MSTMKTEPIIERKVVKHIFTSDEKLDISDRLARTLDEKDRLAEEFEQVKKSYKAKESECDARIGQMGSDLRNGFTMREQDCRVEFRPKDRKKDYYLVNSKNGDPPVHTEDMKREDFQIDLIQVEKQFANRSEIVVFLAGEDQGTVVVGTAKNKWHGALRVRIGKHTLDERLNPETYGYKLREDCLKKTAERLQSWLVESLGKEAAKGFEDGIKKAIESEQP